MASLLGGEVTGNRGNILSCPDAFLGFNSFSAFYTSTGCIVLKLNGLISVIVDTADLIA